MATLAGNTIASTYPLLLKIDSSGIDGTLRAVQDGDATDSALSIATDSVLVKGSGIRLYFHDADGGEHIAGDGTDLTITSGNDIVLATGGSVYGAGKAGTSNTVYGKSAGASLDAGSNYNVFVGEGVSDASMDDAINNVGVGYQSLSALIQGDDNTAVGYRSLLDLEDGDYNVGIGSSAGRGITDGENNVAIGYQALDANVTGNINVAIGTSALGAFIGSAAVAVGREALRDANHASAADGSVAIGQGALAAMTDSPNNTAVGYQAGGVTTGGYNTYVGYQAGKGASGAEANNVAVGSNALTAITSGQYNVAIGFQAGDALTSMTHNTIIGTDALSTSSLVDQCVVIGSQAAANGAVTAAADGTVAIGYAALTAISSGEHNTAVGFNALNDVVTANGCTAVGKNTLASVNKDGNSLCTAVGFQAGTAVTDGVNNSMYGCDSGVALIGGDDNTLLGKGAGRTLTTGDDNTIIGSMADSEGTGTNRAVGIGRDVTAVQDYTTLGDGSDDIRAAHGTATWATVSDQRFKKDIETSTAGLSFIKDLRPVTYKWKSKGEIPDWSRAYEEGSEEQYKNSKHNHGFIAQEVKQAIDNHSEIKDGFSMWYELSGEGSQQEVGETALVPMLVKAVQELSAKVKALEDA